MKPNLAEKNRKLRAERFTQTPLILQEKCNTDKAKGKETHKVKIDTQSTSFFVRVL
jgi:hypothetical protein